MPIPLCRNAQFFVHSGYNLQFYGEIDIKRDCNYTGSKFPDKIGVQWLFAEPLTVKWGFFMSQLRSLGMGNGSWLQVEPLNCEPRLPSGGQA